MKRIAVAVLLLASVCAFGQTGVTFPDTCAQNRLGINAPCPKPLKCGKYEHEAYHTQSCPDGQPVGCALTPNPTPYCAPIMHEVTEKEWQALMTYVNQQLRENCRFDRRLNKKSTAPCDAKDAFRSK